MTGRHAQAGGLAEFVAPAANAQANDAFTERTIDPRKPPTPTPPAARRTHDVAPERPEEAVDGRAAPACRTHRLYRKHGNSREASVGVFCHLCRP